MPIEIIRTVLLIISVMLYDFLFWTEKLGVNALIFSLLMIVAHSFFYPDSIKSTRVRVAIIATLSTAICVVYHNSLISKITYLVSCWMLIGFWHEPRLCLVFSAWLEALYAVLHLYLPIKEQFQYLKTNHQASPKTNYFRYVKLGLIPFAVFVLFLFIFKFANPIFDDMTNQIGNKFFEFIGQFFEGISILRVVFVLSGFILVCTALLQQKNKVVRVLKLELEKQDALIRTRKKIVGLTHKFTALKEEYQIGVMLIVLVNLLLVVVNIIDIQFLWLNFDVTEHESLSQLVHKGTYTLIFSILLSMGILMYFFRRNLNFYPKNQWLKISAYTWIFQNVILVISVALRTYYYISEYGLAYKRIGVLLFLTLTIFGLYSLFIKIKKCKSDFYLWRVNGWAMYVMLIFMASINWDVLIVTHNLEKAQDNPRRIDIQFLMTRSNKTIPKLIEYQALLKGFRYNPYEDCLTYLNRRIKHYQELQNEYSWKSWSYADYKAIKYINQYQSTQ